MLIRSNLYELTISNSPTLLRKQQRLLALVASHDNKHFLTITSGIFETTMIASNALRERAYIILTGEKIVSEITDLASITIRLTENIVTAPGSYAQILKLIAWEGINVIEVVSTYLELTIILHQDEADQAFFVLKSSFK